MGTFGGKQQTLHLHQLIQIIKSDNGIFLIISVIKKTDARFPGKTDFLVVIVPFHAYL